MIRHPKIGQGVKVNYGDRTRANVGIPKNQMPYQGSVGEVVAVGRGIRNALIKFPTIFHGEDIPKSYWWAYCVIPHGNLNRIENKGG